MEFHPLEFGWIPSGKYIFVKTIVFVTLYYYANVKNVVFVVLYYYAKDNFSLRENEKIFFMLQSSQVKRTPQNAINEFIIRKLSPLAVVDVRFISTFLHA